MPDAMAGLRGVVLARVGQRLVQPGGRRLFVHDEALPGRHVARGGAAEEEARHKQRERCHSDRITH